MSGVAPESGLARIRRDYLPRGGLNEADLAGDWPTQFGAWFADAVAAGVPEPNAMVLGTADATGRPSARTVLLKGYDRRGFVYFTNLRSRKATEALANPYASLVFAWLELHRQVVACGAVVPVPRAETEAYFAQRPRGAQLGAWASPQSEVVGSRGELDNAYAGAARRFPGDVPAPPHWGGLRVVPETVEFWQGRADRMHDRLRYRLVAPERSGGASDAAGSGAPERSGGASDAAGSGAPERSCGASDAAGSGAGSGAPAWVVERLAP